jgi:hypothetical protein
VIPDRFQSRKVKVPLAIEHFKPPLSAHLTMVFLPLEICHLRRPLELGHKDFTRNCHHTSTDQAPPPPSARDTAVNGAELSYFIVSAMTHRTEWPAISCAIHLLKQKIVLLLDLLGLDKPNFG